MNAVEQLYSSDIIEIVLDLPMPPSINRLWRMGRGRMFRSDAYVRWAEQADMTVMAARQYPKRKIGKHFTIDVKLSANSKADGDNVAAKAILDWLQSRDVISNDKFCCRGSWEWVSPDEAPAGCRVTLRSLHGEDGK